MRLALGQINTTVGDIAGNAERVRDGIRAARDAGADLVLFPELALTGYPPEDLLLKEHFLADAARGPAASSPPRPPGSSRWSASPSAPKTSTTPLAVLARRAPSTPSTARCTCPTTASSTSSATSRPGRAGAVHRDRRRPRRADDLRGHLGARAAGQRRGARRGDADRQHLRLALPRRQGRRARAHVRPARPRQRRLRRLLRARRRPGRARLRRPLLRASTTPARTIARAAQFREELLVCDVDLERRRGRPPARRLTPPRRAALAAAEVQPAAAPARARRAAAASTAGSRALAEPLAPEEAEVYCALALGLSDYVRQERLRARRPRASPAGSTPRWSPAWPPTPCGPSGVERRDHALALLLCRDPGRRPRARRSARDRRLRAPDRDRRWTPTTGLCGSSSPGAMPA